MAESKFADMLKVSRGFDFLSIQSMLCNSYFDLSFGDYRCVQRSSCLVTLARFPF